MDKTQSDYKIFFFDVGHGDATLIQNIPTGRSVLIDANESIPVLDALGHADQLDAIFVTHWDADHINGIPHIVSRMSGSRQNRASVFINLQTADTRIATRLKKTLREAQEDGKIEIRPACISRDLPDSTNQIHGKFDILWPHYKDLISKSGSDRNFTSLVLRFQAGLFSILLGGDADGEVWPQINHKKIEADVLKYPHHGAQLKKKNQDRAWSAEDIVLNVKPDWVIVSVGENNVYGHPSEEFIAARSKFSETRFLSTENGTIEMRVISVTGKVKSEQNNEGMSF